MNTFMKSRRWLVAAALMLSPALAWSATATQQLQDFIKQVPTATGQFSQQRVVEDGTPPSAQSGTFAFKRPGQFRWDVQKPYQQLIVSDGKKVYQYDPDLAQVTQRSVDASLGASPAAILFGSGALDDAFKLADLPTEKGVDRLRATPHGSDAGFTHVDISFKDGLPVQLDLLDAFGQTTKITLSNINTSPTLSANEFTFTAPAGVDVVNM